MQQQNNRPSAAKQALIVIDAQRDFCPGGALAAGEDLSFLPKVNALIDKIPCVILTQDWHPQNHISFAASHENKQIHDTAAAPCGEQILWPRHCVRGTKGAEFHPDLRTDTARLIIRKGIETGCDSRSAFFDAAASRQDLAAICVTPVLRGCFSAGWQLIFVSAFPL